MKNREARTVTLMPARLRTDLGWSDVVIRNVSSRGAMLQLSGTAPSRGTYVELRRATLVVVGRIVWSNAERCGISTRERIDLNALTTMRGARTPAGGDRRHIARQRATLDPSSDVDKRAIEAVALVAIAMALSAMVGGAAYQALSRPAALIHAAMETARL